MEIIDQNVTTHEHCFPSIRPRPLTLDWDVDNLPEEVERGVDFIMFVDTILHVSRDNLI